MNARVDPIETDGALPVVWRERPFVGELHRREVDLAGHAPTIAEIVASIPEHELPAGFAERGQVIMTWRRGEELFEQSIPRAMWPYVRPRRGSTVSVGNRLQGLALVAPPASGNLGKILGLVAMIALLVTVAWITGGGLAPFLGGFFAAGKIGALLAATGVALVGQLAISALTPPPELPQPEGNDASGREASSIEGNVMSRGGSIPRVVGTRRVFPPLAGPPLVDLDPGSEDEIIEALFVLAGPHLMEDVRIGESAAADNADVHLELVPGFPGDPQQSLVTRQSYTDAPQLTLSAHKINPDNETDLEDQSVPDNSIPRPHDFVTRKDPDEVWLLLQWPEGLIDEDSPDVDKAVPVRFQMRLKGDSTWINLPEIHFRYERGTAHQRMIKFKWEAGPSALPVPEDKDCPYLAYKLVPGQTVLTPTTSGWTANSHFSAGAGNDVYEIGTAATTNVRNVVLYRSVVEFYLSGATFPQGTWEIRVLRGAVYLVASFTRATYFYNNGAANQVHDLFTYRDDGGGDYEIPRSYSHLHHKMVVGRLTSIWNEYPVADGDFAQIALKARNRRIERISVEASGYVRDWNAGTAAWQDWVTSSNPAPHVRDVLAGRLTADPVPPALIDDTSLVAWRTECIAMGHEANAVIQGRSAAEVIQLLASTGYARGRFAETFGVVMDRDVSAGSPVQMFNPRNFKSFRWAKSFSRLPDGFRVVFRNAEDDDKREEIIVPRDGFSEESAKRLEEVNYDAITDEDAARARGEFDLAQATARARRYFGETNSQALVCTLGDLVAVQSDILEHDAGFALIKEKILSGSNVNLIRLDAKIPICKKYYYAQPDYYSQSNRYYKARKTGVSIRLRDGSFITKEVTGEGEEAALLTFATPFADLSTLAADCLVSSGPLGSEIKRLIVMDIKPAPNLGYVLEFVDEAPELFA